MEGWMGKYERRENKKKVRSDGRKGRGNKRNEKGK